jgi:hypothetical protein
MHESVRANLWAILPDLKNLLMASQPFPDLTDEASVTAWVATMQPLFEKLVADFRSKSAIAEASDDLKAELEVLVCQAVAATVTGDNIRKIDWATLIAKIIELLTQFLA